MEVAAATASATALGNNACNGALAALPAFGSGQRAIASTGLKQLSLERPILKQPGKATFTRVTTPMKNRCLPTYLIVTNVFIAMSFMAGSVLLAANLEASANNQQQKTEALRQLFVYQILAGVEQQN